MFDTMLATLEREIAFTFAYVTAPPDIRMTNLDVDAQETQRWNAHANGELMPILPSLPFYLVGYSGGAALAFNGLHQHERCFGGGRIGADAIPSTFEPPVPWSEPLRLYYNSDDRVFGANAEALREFEERGQVQLFRRLAGGHALVDYIANESLGGLIRCAARMAPS